MALCALARAMLERGYLTLAAGYAAASVAGGFVTGWLASGMVRQVRIGRHGSVCARS